MKGHFTHLWMTKVQQCATLIILLFFFCFYAFPQHIHSPSSPSLLRPSSTYDPSPVYNRTIAWKALHFCKSSYCPVENISSWKCGNACSNATADFHVFNVYDNVSTGNFGFSGMDHEAKKIVIAFRGTTSITNWIQDLKFFSMPYPHSDCGELCTVHRGFYQAYASMREQLIQDVLTMHSSYPSYSLFITGHSLGGAMAVLSAIEFTTWRLPRAIQHRPLNIARNVSGPLWKAGDPVHLVPVELYTFGEPRVGNAYFTNWSTQVLSLEHQYRVTHARDPVPHLPPRSWSYIHIPQEHWYPADDDVFLLCADSSLDEDPACSNSVYATTVSDHLLYLGVCTRCECTAADMADIYNYTLDPKTLMILQMEYLMDHRAAERQGKLSDGEELVKNI